MNPVYVEQVINPLKELFLQDSLSGVPSITINENSDLGLISTDIASSAVTIKDHESEADQLNDIFNSIGNYFDNDQNVSRLSIIDKTSKSFALSLERSYEELNSKIIPLANTITEKIVNRYRELMIRENADNLLTDQNEPSESQYSFLDWGSKSPSEITEIIETACINANINVKDLTPSNLSYVIAKMNFSAGMKQINFPEDVKKTIIDKLIVAFKDTLIEDDVQSYFRIVTDINAYTNFCNRLVQKVNDAKNLGQSCLDVIQTVRSAMIFINKSKPVIADDLNLETIEDLASNIDILLKTIFALKYWLLLTENLTFKDKLIVSGTIINKPVYENFLREGKTISDIYKYLKAFHITTNVPSSGISLATVVSTDANDRLDKVNQRIESNTSFIKSKCLINAFTFSMQQLTNDEIIVSTFPELESNDVKQAFYKFAINLSNNLKGNIDNVSDVVLSSIIFFFHKGSIIEVLYRYLGSNFSNLVDEGEDIDNESILQSQCNAVTELLIDFLFKNGIVQ